MNNLLSKFSNCKKCDKAFAVTLKEKYYCASCSSIEEETFKDVREYIYKYPGSTPHEVAAATNLPVQKILDYIREGRVSAI